VEQVRNRLDIRTPEGITFSLHLAGVPVRALAMLIDYLVMIAALSLVQRLGAQVGILLPGLSQFALFLAAFFILTGYFIALEWLWNGRTVGKWVMKLRVADQAGLRLHFGQVVLRNLLRPVDMLPAFYLAGGVAAFLNRHSQRLGDFAANTVVLRKPPEYTPNIAPLVDMKYNSFRAHPHVCARLRQAVSPEEARIAVEALQRRDTLEPAARIEAFEAIARRFRQAAPFPEEATFGLTDEQYVRNAVDVIYRARNTVQDAGPAAAANA
jgi:uncharacterized RDD family membrane protein YckC